ncbi:MAG TPA: T9SS type A sorting domain-containing protein [Bacteroidia bacterium]|nr:T9SS type A sorting domain-containing protein [Bacteroidia bacterium]
MKTQVNLTSVFFCVFFLCYAFIRAQLSGTVSINSAQPTAGSNYQSFNALATVINSLGLSGPLTVNVAPSSGPYTEQVQFKQIPGASATNSILINGNNTTLAFTSTSSAAPWTLLMNGTDRMNINNLNIHALGLNYALACILTAGADYNIFTSCTFSLSPVATGLSQIPFCISSSSLNVSNGANSANYTQVLNCKMYNGYYNVVMAGLNAPPYQLGNGLYNCTLSDFYAYGLYSAFQVNSMIQYNSVERPLRNTTSSCYALAFYSNSGLRCENNCVQNLFNAIPSTTHTAYGVYSNGDLGLPAAVSIYSNNVVRGLKNNGTQYGICILDSPGMIYGNSVILDDPNAGTANNCYGLYTYYTNNNDSIRIRYNKLFVTRSGTGVKYCGYYVTPTKCIINNNSYYMMSSSGTTFTAYYWASGSCAGLSQMQAAGIEQNGNLLTANFPSQATCAVVPTPTVVTGQISNRNDEIGYRVQVFPNPANDVLNFSFIQNAVHHIEVLQVDGSVLLSAILEPGASSLPVSELKPGVYIIRYSEGNRSGFQRLLVSDQ